MECQLWQDCMQIELKINGTYPSRYVFDFWQDCMQKKLKIDGTCPIRYFFEFWQDCMQKELKIEGISVVTNLYSNRVKNWWSISI